MNKLESQENEIGYNAATDKWENMVEAGIIDPTKVTRTALQNAASIAALLLTTEAVAYNNLQKLKLLRKRNTFGKIKYHSNDGAIL